MRPPIVEVVWRDAILRSGPCSVKDVRIRAKPFIRRTVGYLAHLTRRDVVLGITFDAKEPDDAEHYFDDLYYIPRRWIVELNTLRKGRK